MAEETVFIIETGGVLCVCVVRFEAEETIQHRACSMVIVNVFFDSGDDRL